MIFDKDDFKAYDADLWNAIAKEEERQQNNIELIASENVVSKAVMAAQGSILTNKYAEGYPGRRYYGGTDVVDVVETLAIERAKEIFGAKFANVQPHSGSQANCAAYMALIEPGDTVMGMDLAAGGHLTHGAPVSFSGQTYNFVSYSVDPETELLDFDAILKQAQEVKPKLIVAAITALETTFSEAINSILFCWRSSSLAIAFQRSASYALKSSLSKIIGLLLYSVTGPLVFFQ